MKSDKVYVVTSGSYSDYSIECVFSTREKAEEYLQYHDDEYRIEEFALDEEFAKNESRWEITIDLSSDEVGITKEFHPLGDEYIKTLNCMTLHKIPRYYKDKSLMFRTWVRTATKDRAIKVARERLVAAKANEVIWLRLQIRDDDGEYPIYNCYTNELVK